MSESANANAPAEVVVDDKPVEQIVEAHDEPEVHDETPPADPRDALINEQRSVVERLTNLLMEKERNAAPAAPKAPEADPIEAALRAEGFGNVGYRTDETGAVVNPGVNMIPGLLKVLALHGKNVLGTVDKAVSPRLSQIGEEIAGTKFERALAVRVQRQTPEFIAFRDTQIAKGGTLTALREHDPDAAAELIEARWRSDRRAVKAGEERRQERVAGGGLATGAPRGSNGAGPVLRVSASDPNIASKLVEFADRGGDAKNIHWLKRGEK